MILPMDCIGHKLAGYLTRDYLFSGFDGKANNKIRIDKMTAMDEKRLGKAS